MTETSRPNQPSPLDTVTAMLPELDGATLEWWRYSITHGQCVWRVSNLPRGVGYISMVGTYYINVPPIMHNVRLRIATHGETEALRQRLPELGDSLRERQYRFIECNEGTFAIWSKGFCVIWDELEAARMVRDM